MATVCAEPAPVRTATVADERHVGHGDARERDAERRCESVAAAPAMRTVRPSTVTVPPAGASVTCPGVGTGKASGSVSETCVSRSAGASERAVTVSATSCAQPAAVGRPVERRRARAAAPRRPTTRS